MGTRGHLSRSRALLLIAAAVIAVSAVAGAPAAATHGWHAAWVGQDPWPVLVPGAVTSYTFRFRNTGTETWQRGVPGRQVNLAAGGGDEQYLRRYAGPGWLWWDRPATTNEATVGPGQIASFTFSVLAPADGLSIRIYAHPVLEGVQHLEDEGAYVLVTGSHGFHSRWVSQSPYPTVDPGQVTPPMTIAFRNAGTRAWVRGVFGQQANLGLNGDDRTLAPYAVSWPTPDRVAIQNEPRVEVGQVGTFTFQMRGPAQPGVYQLHLRPVVDGVTWMEDEGVFMYVTVRGAVTRVPTLTATVIQSGLRIPWDVAFAPDGRMFVTERVGNILVYASAAPGAPQVANIPVPNIRASGEAGAMSIELDPGFASNGLFYVCASVTDSGQWLNQVLRFRISGNSAALDLHVIRFGMRANTNHDGCRVRFGPDGKLWVTMGDAGNTANARDPNSLNGKVLRVNSDGTIPADNPVMPGAAGRTAVYTMGNRNPQGLTFEPGTGRPIEVEHGDSTHDEINILRAGADYGYPICRGPCGDPRFVDPAWSSGSVTIATSGADFARGPQWGAWDGSLFVAQLAQTDLRRFTIAGAVATERETLYNGTYGRLRTVRQGPDGSLYITTSNGTGDRVIRITPS
ncbi:MAG TPA: PQQ-dependent sugar dehydrogenase [Candidatus Limnocylindria bacterium]|nr:PQQ-dependent sugar dehydrogenase [Candidatus Limnocylindria bacterium]